MVVEISLTKNLERKKKGQTQVRTNRRMSICNPTIQLFVVNLYTKYEISILNGWGDVFDQKVLRNYGKTDGRTDGNTDRCKLVYPSLFQSGGIITKSDHSGPNHKLLQLCTACTAWSDSDQAVPAVHSCYTWLRT